MWRKSRGYLGATFEVCLITLLCLLYAGSPPPGKNEAHYLGKARHYWQPTWCEGDFFYDSGDAHEVFFWTFGWITQHFSLSTSAWIGRLLAWTLFALSWRVFVARLSSKRWAALLAVVMLIPLLHYGHLAGEWLIGGIEAKGFAYPLVFLALAKAVEGRWWIVWPLLGLASCFHVLIGGWAVVAHLLAWWFRHKEDKLQFRQMLPWLILGGVLALPGLWPAIMLKGNATPAQTIEANITYSFRRLSHHLVFYRFAPARIACFVAACLAWWQTRRWIQTDKLRRLDAIVLGSLCIAAGGFWLDILLAPLNNLRAAVMRFYWFRLSDVMVPIGIVANTIAVSDTQLPIRRRVMVVAVLLGSVGFGCAMRVDGLGARSSSLRQQAWRLKEGRTDDPIPAEEVDAAWLDACEWVKNSTDLPPRSQFLTPTRQQTFKWYAQRPDVVTWKDIPQDAEGIVAWWQRREEVYLLGRWPWIDRDKLANIIQAYGVTHIVWPYSKQLATEYPIPDDVEQLYRNELFAVYALPKAIAPAAP